MASAQAPAPATLHRRGAVAVGHQHTRVLVHFDRPITWLSVSGPEALALARDLVASARAAGVVPPTQRNLF